MTILNNTIRDGSFTSSEIVALTSEPSATAKKAGAIWGKPALTYIEETNFERKLGRSLDIEQDARAFTWGHFCEPIAFNQLGLEYVMSSDITTVHPEMPYWCGSKDGFKNDPGKTVLDFKSPITLKSFCQLVDPLYNGLTGIAAMNHIRENHKDGDKYYWQLVSNSCIDKAKYAELIVFMPYRKFLPDIRMEANKLLEDDKKYWWIANSEDAKMPYLPDNGYYKDLNIIRFEVPQEDKDFLTGRVKAAGKMLIAGPKQLQAPDDSTPYSQTEIKASRQKGDLLI